MEVIAELEIGTRPYLRLKNGITGYLPSVPGEAVDVNAIAVKLKVEPEVVRQFLVEVFPRVQPLTDADGKEVFQIADTPVDKEALVEEPGRDWMRRARTNRAKGRYRSSDPDEESRW